MQAITFPHRELLSTGCALDRTWMPEAHRPLASERVPATEILVGGRFRHDSEYDGGHIHMTATQKLIGQRLASVREAASVRQEDAAAALGLS